MKEGTKVLGMHGFFELPDDFQGDLPQALRLFADYWEEAEKNGTHKTIDNTGDNKIDINGAGAHKSIWLKFLDALKRERKFYGWFSIAKKHKDKKQLIEFR